MSYVTNIILSFSIGEDATATPDAYTYSLMEQINAWLLNKHHSPFGQDAAVVAGGEKHLETPVYLAAFNYFDLKAFCQMLRGLPWCEPEHVQVFVQDQDDDHFRLITITHTSSEETQE